MTSIRADEKEAAFFAFKQLKLDKGVKVSPKQQEWSGRNALVNFPRKNLIVTITNSDSLALQNSQSLMRAVMESSDKNHLTCSWKNVQLNRSLSCIRASCCQEYLIASSENELLIFPVMELVQVFLVNMRAKLVNSERLKLMRILLTSPLIPRQSPI